MLNLLLYIVRNYFIWVVLSAVIYIYRRQLLDLMNGFQRRRAHMSFLKEQTYNRYDFKARFELGLHYLHLGNYQDAIHLFKEALEADPDNADLHFYLGITFQKLRNHDFAISEFKNCLNLKKDYGSGQALLKLGDAYRFRHDYSEALNYYLQMLTINPYEGEALYKIGFTNYLLGVSGEANKYLNQAITEIKALPKFAYKKDRIWLYKAILLKLLLSMWK
jgi:tetratricopeptide (TPR) repeat protein